MLHNYGRCFALWGRSLQSCEFTCNFEVFFFHIHTRACNRAHHHNIACEVWQPVTGMSCHNVTVDDDERVQSFSGLSSALNETVLHALIIRSKKRAVEADVFIYVNRFPLTEVSNGQKKSLWLHSLRQQSFANARLQLSTVYTPLLTDWPFEPI